jgi:hypothetical protein
MGNSVEVMNHEMAEWIDSHDVVCRCGKGIMIDDNIAPAIGRKTDVWFTGSLRAKLYNSSLREKYLKDISLILFSKSSVNYELYSNMPDSIGETGIAYHMYTHEETVKFMRSYGSINGLADSIRPSMGLNAIKYMVEEVETYKKLTIYGFDFFRKYTKNPNPDPSRHLLKPYSWHLPVAGIQIHPHDHEKEISYVNEWISKGLLEWKIISDLDESRITKTKYGNF